MKIHAVKYMISLLLALVIMSGGINASIPTQNNQTDASFSHGLTIHKIDLNKIDVNCNSEFNKNSKKLNSSQTAIIDWKISTNIIFANEIILPGENRTRTAYRLLSTLKM